MKSSTNRVLKSLDELSPDLFGDKAAAPEKTAQPEPQLMREAEQRTIQPIRPAVFQIRGYRGWGINE